MNSAVAIVAVACMAKPNGPAASAVSSTSKVSLVPSASMAQGLDAPMPEPLTVTPHTVRIDVKLTPRKRNFVVNLIREDQPNQIHASGVDSPRSGWFWLYWENGTHCVGLFSPEQTQEMLNFHVDKGHSINRIFDCDGACADGGSHT
jgi:hypothetical protein